MGISLALLAGFACVFREGTIQWAQLQGPQGGPSDFFLLGGGVALPAPSWGIVWFLSARARAYLRPVRCPSGGLARRFKQQILGGILK